MHDVTVECVRGDITRQSDVECLVNAANAELQMAEQLQKVRRIRFVLFGEDDHRIHVEALKTLTREREN